MYTKLDDARACKKNSKKSKNKILKKTIGSMYTKLDYARACQKKSRKKSQKKSKKKLLPERKSVLLHMDSVPQGIKKKN
jgi:hypothetical protein